MPEKEVINEIQAMAASTGFAGLTRRHQSEARLPLGEE